MTDIADNLARVRAAIATAAEAAGRRAEDVTLIAVAKGHGADDVRAAYAEGQRDFGENYVQEWQEKAAALADLADIRWHFLGHLQRNKIRQVIGKVALLHSADDMAGIDEMQRAAWSQNVKQDVLLQINLADEAQKRGCGEDDAELFIDVLSRSPNLRLCGLMTLPPAENLIALDTRLVRICPRRSGSPISRRGTSGATWKINCRLFSEARTSVMLAALSRTEVRLKLMVSTENLPASIFEKSRISLMMLSKAEAEDMILRR